MKFVHLLPILGIAAAFGATRQASDPSTSSARPAAAALASVVPPWLTGALPAEPAEDEGSAIGELDTDLDVCRREPAPEVAVATNIERASAPNGHTIADVFAQRAALDGQTVVVRGTVVKLTEGVLGKTYLHLRDGSGSAHGEDDDLTATTTERFELGQTLDVEGVLAIDQDVGAGYRYAALLTSARPRSR